MSCLRISARLVVALLLFSLVTVFSTQFAYGAGTTGSIAGLVLDQSTGKGLVGATVTAKGKTVSTDSSGKYTLTAIPTGAQTVTASASLYKSASTTVSVPRNATVTAPTLTLAQNWGSVSGTVTNSSGAAVINATVAVSGTSLSALTNSVGYFSLSKVPAGTQTVTVSATSYSSASQSVAILSGGNATANFSLRAPTGPTGPGSTIPWNGQNWYLSGNNYAWYNYGTDFGTGGWGKYTNWSQINTDFATMRSQGVKVARWWVFADGRYAPDFNADGTVSGLDSYVLGDIDQALDIASRNNIYLVLTLMDFNMWKAAQGSGGVTGGGHSALITNATVQQTYLDSALKPLLQHIAASPYKNAVLAYDICNEPEFTIAETGFGSLPLAQVQSFTQKCAAYIHQYGGGGYATLGSGKFWWVGYWKGLGLDFYQLHWYPPFGDGALPTYASLNLDRPCIVGEYGTADASFGIGDTNPQSAQWYLDTIYNQGYAGQLGWAYANIDGQCNWAAFQPVYTNWANAHIGFIGPQ